ncbi:AlbA family DNA-binding domain-containing protein [Methanospirillum hungatei]|uniref:AlbA family DNA-binding domain-containing protein n=1 Tax=Methanospirillum hungatei TaxID=2203 RepID=UPI00005E0D58|nr:ATP-binding protein [Methanospirillum hungatei]
MAAFANAEGEIIYIGVADDGTIPRLTSSDVSRINQLISNTASQSIKSPLTVKTENVFIGNDRVVIILTIPKGQDKPYFDRNGVIWFKNGADKRKINRSYAVNFYYRKIYIY